MTRSKSLAPNVPRTSPRPSPARTEASAAKVAGPLKPGDRVRDILTGSTGTVESVTGWIENRIKVRKDKPGKPMRGVLEANRLFMWPRSTDCVRIGGAS
jgi:hypothetical protein